MRLRGWLAVAVCILSSGGCASGPPFAGEGAAQRALGSFAVDSKRLGRITVVPALCSSGERLAFLGADFADEKTRAVVRLVVDPLAGPAARAFAVDAPYDKTLVFGRSQCRVFHFSLEGTGWRIDGITDYRVTLELDCTATNGDSIVGTASAGHCH